MAVSSNLQGPLSVGNVVSAGLRLYSNHFKQYFGVALVATLWVLLPFVIGALLVSFFGLVPDLSALLWLAIPAWFVLLLYCMGRYLAGAAAIGRLAFGELTNQPETAQNAKRFTNSRQWSFVWMSVLVSLIYFAIVIVMYIVAFVILFALLAGSGLAGLAENASLEQLFTTNPALAIGVSLLVVLLVLGLIAFLLWLGARLSVPELSLAVEREATASGAISRSWQLTKSNAWRVALVLFVTFLITLPLVILTQLVVNALQAAFMVTVSEETPGYAGLLLLVSYAFSFLSNVFMLPLWQAIKATIYYDLRSRREGIDLELRDRRL
ncbi:MAG: hypothetical protein MUF72_20425 [Elainella sp. Prado103]|nr:hypothetical protein [Elainella sp. Prado103]